MGLIESIRRPIYVTRYKITTPPRPFLRLWFNCNQTVIDSKRTTQRVNTYICGAYLFTPELDLIHNYVIGVELY